MLAPPETPQPKATFGTPLKNDNPGHPVDLDMDDMVVPDEKQEEEEDDDVDEHIELDELEGTPFTYFYLSAEDSPQVLNAEEDDENDDDVILTEEPSPPVNTAKDLDEEEGRKQATTHISVSPDVVLASTGEEREKWLAAGRKEIDNLTIPKAITALSPQERTALKEKAQLEGEDFIELPAKVVFTIKPEKYKIRIVACGNQTKDTYGKITTTDLDTCMLRFILSWAASSRFNTIASLGCHRCILECRSSSWKGCGSQTTNSVVQTGSYPNWLCVASAQSCVWSQRSPISLVQGEDQGHGDHDIQKQRGNLQSPHL